MSLLIYSLNVCTRFGFSCLFVLYLQYCCSHILQCNRTERQIAWKTSIILTSLVATHIQQLTIIYTFIFSSCSACLNSLTFFSSVFLIQKHLLVQSTFGEPYNRIHYDFHLLNVWTLIFILILLIYCKW